MAEAARDLGHEWIALTDHSPRLTVANGLSAERLRAQLELVGELNDRLAPFRILTGIEVDILEDGSLDQDPALLGQLDVVVASVHSQLRMDPPDPLLRLAGEMGCVFAIDSDAHAPDQLDWLGNGTVRAEEFGISADRIINTRRAEDLREPSRR